VVHLRKGDLIQYNLNHWDGKNDELANWVVGLVLGIHTRGPHMMRVFWFDDYQETEEPNPQKDESYRMFSPGSSVG
jgi:hypothetical protein